MTVTSVILNTGFTSLCVFFVLILVLYFYFKNSFKYWGKRNVPHDEPCFPFGSLKGALNTNFSDFFKELYTKMRLHKYFGIWISFKPIIIVNDPDLIKQILIKEFNSFHDRGMYYHEEADPLSDNLVTLDGEEWKQRRSKLSPAFSPNKIKMMLPSIAKCSEELVELLRKPAEMKETVDIKDLASRFTTDVIACCCFGIKEGSLKDPKAKMRIMAKKLLEPSATNVLKNTLWGVAPDLAKRVRLRVNSKEVENFFMETFRQVVEYREINNITANDLMQSLMDLKENGFKGNKADEKNENLPQQKLSFEQLAAEAYMFAVAGTDTTSITMQFALFELSLNQLIQEKARTEVKRVLTNCGEKISYESIGQMKYLEKIVEETLRKYPPAGLIVRNTAESFRIPNTEITIEKGTPVLISSLDLQRDERYYPDPEKFDPERFSAEGKAARHPCVYLPFGDGPRNCIGKSFAILELKVVLASLLLNFKFDLPENYHENGTGILSPNANILIPKAMNLNISVT